MPLIWGSPPQHRCITPPAQGTAMPAPPPTRTALLDLHRALVEGERRDYEKAHGRVSGGDFLQALIRDPAFAWLTPLTRLIARLDELEDAEGEGTQPESAATVLAAIRALLSLCP